MNPIRFAAAAVFLGIGPAMAQDTAAQSATPTAAEQQALVALIAGPAGEDMGEVHAIPTASGMMHLVIRLSGLPEGTHGIHIHETGACTPDFGAAGGHLADDKAHGVRDADGPHPGDLPNVHVPASGEITVEYFVPGLTRELMEDSGGSAFIVHADADDYTTQPTGNAGGRLACGVFG